jgi:2',3'-cyclic-nucleotide 2'-phosphodiesterase (5'-nucleotidase family)
MKLKWGIVALLCIGLWSCKVNHLSSVKSQTTNVFEVGEDATLRELVAPYKAALDDEMDEVIGKLGERLETGRPEGSLGNWFADVLVDQASIYLNEKVDLGVMNSGGIRISSLEKGDVKRRKIFELMPFENGLTVLYLKGKDLERFIQFMAYRGGWPVSKSLQYNLDVGKAKQIRLHNKAIQENEIYSIAISDYIANGGDSSGLKIMDRKETGKSVRDAVFDYFADRKDEEIFYENRVRIKKENDE